MTLAQDKRFRAKNQEIKKMSYNVIMHNPRLAKDSVKIIRDNFAKADMKGKQNIIDMVRMAAAASTANSKDNKRYKRAQREQIHEIAIMYKTLRTELHNELKKLQGDK